MPIFIYVVWCFVVAILGIDRKMGFYGDFIASVLLTPIIGGLPVLVSAPRKQ